MPKHIVASDRLMQPIAHFSHGARVGETIHLGAAAGVDAGRRLAGTTLGVGDMTAQTERLFANQRIALEALGGTWQDVVRVKTYIVDWRDLPAYEAVHARQFDAPYPAACTVGTWGFPLPQIMLEAELVASLDVSGRTGCLHYCTAVPVDEHGEIAAPLEPRSQSDRVLHNLAATLERAGLRLADVVMLTTTLADIRALQAFEEALRRHFSPPYPARSVVGCPLSRAGQCIEIESVAAYGGGTPVAIPQGAGRGVAASAGMLAGDWLFVSAQAGGDEAGARTQARRALERIAATVTAAGMTLEDVVRTNIVLSDWRHYAAFNAAYGAFVTRPYPPRATVHGVLSDPAACVQIEAIAHRRGRYATVLEAAPPSEALGA